MSNQDSSVSSDVPRIGVVGVSGRMGRMLVEEVASDNSVQLSGVTEQSNHPWIGKNLADLVPHTIPEITILNSPEEAFSEVDAIIDFSTPTNSVGLADFASLRGVTHVIGTTGFKSADLSRISRSASSAVIIRAGNMSQGVNLLVGLTQTVSEALGVEFDIEIVEHHHRHKVDAPSGTALMLGDAAAKGRQIPSDISYVRGRDGITGARREGTIGFSAVRGGDVVGEHDVIFAGQGERIFLRHVATDRAIYARGAIKAALWGLGQKPGEYDMMDVLGMKKKPQ